jgi:hemerythrin-like domain-containing protein
MRGPVDQPGLRLRMSHEARRISSQHRQLDALFALVANAVARGAPREARDAFVRFADAVDAHVSLEDELYFPALRGLRPELAVDLEALVGEHRELREQMQTLRGLFDAAFDSETLLRCEAPLERFVSGVEAHEGREELLIAQVRGPKPEGDA